MTVKSLSDRLAAKSTGGAPRGRPDSRKGLVITDSTSTPRRLVMSCMLGAVAVALALVSATAAHAAAPTITSDSFDVASTITTICAFPVQQTGHISYTARYFTDVNGNLTRGNLSVTEQDTFSAHGITLTTDAYHYALFQAFDSDGNLTQFVGNGVVARIHLPDGGLFLSAGKLSLLSNSEQLFFTPDIGRSGDVTAFCNALNG
jgi:hypothetical protein